MRREDYGSDEYEDDYDSGEYDTRDYDPEYDDSRDYDPRYDDSRDYDPEYDDPEDYGSGYARSGKTRSRDHRSGEYGSRDRGSGDYGSGYGRSRDYDPDEYPANDDYDDYDDDEDDYEEEYEEEYDEVSRSSDRYRSAGRKDRAPVNGASARRPAAGSGSRPAGAGTAGTRSAGSRPSGAGTSGTRTAGSRPSGLGSSGTRSAGSRPSGAGTAAARSAGARPSGSRPSGAGTAATRSAGTRSAGSRPSGAGASGTRSGSRPSGNRTEDRETKSSGSRVTGLVIGLCAVLAIVAVVLVIFLAKEMVRGNSGTETTTAQTAADPAQANAGKEAMAPQNQQTEGMTVEVTESMATVAPTEEPATEELPDGTKYEMPTRAGDAYMLDGQVFSPCCAGHGTGEYYANMVNTVGSRLPSGVTLYDILAPTAFGACLSTQVQEELAGGNQTELIEYINSVIDESKAKTVPAYKNIIRHNAEYIYFNSDHHWTMTGAYYAYQEWCRVKGIEAHTTDFFKEKYEFDGFLGSFYSLAGEPKILEENRDTVVAYVPNGTNKAVFTESDGDEVVWNVVRDVTEWARTSKYNCFIGGDNPYTVIENPEITDGSACMLVKESYGNAFAPFLVDHYQYVYIIDYRYYTGNLTSFIKQNNVQDVIILNNLEAIGGKRADTIQALFP